MYHSIIPRASARAGVEPKLVHFSRTSKWATVRRNARALSPAVSAATCYPNVVQVLNPRTAAVRTWSFRAETKCRRPANASLWPLFNCPRAVRLSPVPSLTAWMCQYSFPFKSMRRALLAGNGAVCRSDSNLTDTWAFFPADWPQLICLTKFQCLLSRTAVPTATVRTAGEPRVWGGDTPWTPVDSAAFKVQLRKLVQTLSSN